jgi:hypothetical protein
MDKNIMNQYIPKKFEKIFFLIFIIIINDNKNKEKNFFEFFFLWVM